MFNAALFMGLKYGANASRARFAHGVPVGVPIIHTSTIDARVSSYWARFFNRQHICFRPSNGFLQAMVRCIRCVEQLHAEHSLVISFLQAVCLMQYRNL